METPVVKVTILDATGEVIRAAPVSQEAPMEELVELAAKVAKEEPEARVVTLRKGNCKVSFKLKDK